MEIKSLAGLEELLVANANVVITTHAKPDGDAIGSSMGMYHYLKTKSIKANVIIPNSMPDFLSVIPEAKETCFDFELKKEEAIDLIANATLIFCLDFNKMSRTGDMEPFLTKSTAKKVVIDHHLGLDQNSFDFIYSNSNKSSTCEMVYDFILFYNNDTIFNLNIIESLYTGMVTDTGGFRFPATSANLHRAVATFFDKGLIHTPIHEEINDSWSLERIKFVGDLLMNELHYFEPGYGIIFINKELQEKYKISQGDTEGIVNLILSIRNVKVAILATDKGNEVKLSFRSKGAIDVNTFANKHFGGGGHFNAAGASSMEGRDVILNKIHSEMPSYISHFILN